MQELKENGIKVEDYTPLVERLKKIDPNLVGVTVDVSEDHESHLVVLKIGENKLHMTGEQALKLAWSLQKMANRLRKHIRKGQGK